MHKPYNSESTLRISILQGSLLSQVFFFFARQKLLLTNSENCEHLKISGMLIMYRPITIEFRIRKQTSNNKNQVICDVTAGAWGKKF